MGKNVWGNSPKAGRLCYSASQSQRRTWFTHKESGQLDPDTVIRPEPGEWHPRMPKRLDEEELADWRAGRNAIYQLAALTVGARLAVADA